MVFIRQTPLPHDGMQHHAARPQGQVLHGHGVQPGHRLPGCAGTVAGTVVGSAEHAAWMTPMYCSHLVVMMTSSPVYMTVAIPHRTWLLVAAPWSWCVAMSSVARRLWKRSSKPPATQMCSSRCDVLYAGKDVVHSSRLYTPVDYTLQ